MFAACGGASEANVPNDGGLASDVVAAQGGPLKGIGDGGIPGPALVLTGPALLSDVLGRLGTFAAERGIALRALEPADLATWFEESKYFAWSKAERARLEQHMALAELGTGWTLTLEQIVMLPGSPWRVSLCGPPVAMASSFLASCALVAEGEALWLWVNEARSICHDPTHELCDEPFAGPLPSLEPVPLSSAVPVLVEPIQVAGEPAVPEHAERDALSVSVHLSAASLPALLDYFAVGYDRAALEARLRTLLGAETSRWVAIQEFMFGWVREGANTFPRSGDNDVCHGPARLFYSDTLHNGDYDRSTEAVAVLLTDHYCRIPDEAAPRFGDYLYNPGAHSARYILRDPASGRDVVFSVQSGGMSAYRFYWADEDMSGDPFAHQPLPDYRSRLVDTWRRCR